MVLLLELLEPGRVVDLIVAFGAAHGRCENSGLVSDGVVVERQSLTQAVFRPLGQRAFNVWEFTFCSSDR